MDDDPQVADERQPENGDFGGTEDVGDGYPEEQQRGAQPEGSDPDHRFPQKGKDRPEG